MLPFYGGTYMDDILLDNSNFIYNSIELYPSYNFEIMHQCYESAMVS